MVPERRFVLLSSVGFCCFISYDLVRRPALSLFAESLGAEPMAIGLIVALSTMTGVLLKLPMGAISDILNRRNLMIVGLLAFAFPPFLYPFVSDIPTLGVLRLCHGLATAVFTPLALAAVAQMYEGQRGEALGWFTSATQGGGLLGPMLGGMMVYAIGFAPTFMTAGVFGVLSLSLFFLIPKRVSSTQPHSKTTAQVIAELQSGLARVLKHPGMLATSFAEAAKMMANGTLMAFLPLYGLSVGLNAAEIGFLFGIQALTSLLSRPVMGRVSDRFGRQPLIFHRPVSLRRNDYPYCPDRHTAFATSRFGRVRLWRSYRDILIGGTDCRPCASQIDRGRHGLAGNHHGCRACWWSSRGWCSH